MYYANHSQAGKTHYSYIVVVVTVIIGKLKTPGWDNMGVNTNLEDSNNLSKSPLGFKCCYKCGNADYLKRGGCPEGQIRDRARIDVCLKKLRIHDPHAKKPRIDNRNQHQYVGQLFLVI